MDYQSFFNNKKITVMGLGLLGRGLGDVKFLAECLSACNDAQAGGADLLVTDLKTEEELQTSVAQLEGFSNIQFVLGEHRLEDFRDRDFILKAAGVPRDSIYIAEARKNNIPIEMSASLMLKLAGIRSIGVTGTRGKSTVTKLINHVLEREGYQTLLGGNIRGVATLPLLQEVTDDSVAVLELDSWQLQGFGESGLSPNIAVFTTFMRDHMTYYHHDMEAYFTDKAQIFLHQKDTDVLVIGSEVFDEFGQWIPEKDKERAVVVDAGKVPEDWSVPIPGEHNRHNVACALAALRVHGLSDEQIKAGIETFPGVEGRLQYMKEIAGVKWYNDNNATAPGATIAALQALDVGNQNVVLICGGVSKSLDMSGLVLEI